MRVINNSAPADYYSQRNNRRSPYAACNVTAMVDALAAARWPLPPARDWEDQQPEDRLMLFIEADSECRHMWRTLDPRGELPPNQWHAVLALGTNRWMGQVIVQFSESVEIPRMIGQLALGGTCVVCGRFPRTSGHLVALVGVAMEEPARPSYWIIDDPYGDYHTNYESERGDDVQLPHEDFLRILNPAGEVRKWCHFVRPHHTEEP